jgi:hypothetical protein
VILTDRIVFAWDYRRRGNSTDRTDRAAPSTGRDFITEALLLECSGTDQIDPCHARYAQKPRLDVIAGFPKAW